MTIDFAALIPVEVKRQTLEADRQRFIAEGYDNQRARDRVQAILDTGGFTGNDVDAATAQIAQFEANMAVIAKAVTAVDTQLAGLGVDA